MGETKKKTSFYDSTKNKLKKIKNPNLRALVLGFFAIIFFIFIMAICFTAVGVIISIIYFLWKFSIILCITLVISLIAFACGKDIDNKLTKTLNGEANKNGKQKIR